MVFRRKGAFSGSFEQVNGKIGPLQESGRTSQGDDGLPGSAWNR